MTGKFLEDLGVFLRFAYPVHSPDVAEGDVFNPALDEFRDGEAFIELAMWLSEYLGLRYGGVIHNYRGCDRSQAKIAAGLTDRHVITITTRPPLSDVLFRQFLDRKVIWPSGTDLEADIFSSFKRCLEICKRSLITLAEPRFLMAELSTTPRAPGECTLEHAERWPMHVLLNEPLPEPTPSGYHDPSPAPTAEAR